MHEHDNLKIGASDPHTCEVPEYTPLTPEEFAYADQAALQALPSLLNEWGDKDKDGVPVICAACASRMAYSVGIAMVQERRKFRENMATLTSKHAAQIKDKQQHAASHPQGLTFFTATDVAAFSREDFLAAIRQIVNHPTIAANVATMGIGTNINGYRARKDDQPNTDRDTLFNTIREILLSPDLPMEGKPAAVRGAIQAYDDQQAAKAEGGQ